VRLARDRRYGDDGPRANIAPNMPTTSDVDHAAPAVRPGAANLATTSTLAHVSGDGQTLGRRRLMSHRPSTVAVAANVAAREVRHDAEDATERRQAMDAGKVKLLKQEAGQNTPTRLIALHLGRYA